MNIKKDRSFSARAPAVLLVIGMLIISVAALALPARSAESTDSGGGYYTYPKEGDNTEAYEDVEADLPKDVTRKINFKKTQHPVQWINLTSSINEREVSVAVLSLKNRSIKVPLAAPGTAKYVNIWVDSTRISAALIGLRVQNSWLASEGIVSSRDLRMYWWDGSKWEMLDTTETSKDGTYTYYEVKYEVSTPYFGYFAISGEKATPTATPTAATSTPTATAAPSDQAGPITINLMFIAGVFVVIAVVVLMYLRGTRVK